MVRGYIASDTPPVLRIKSGQSVKIDTISHAGITDDPVKFFGEAGIPANQILPEVIEIAKLTKDQVRQIAETKMPDLNANDIEAASLIIAGTARSMGITVED